METLVKSRLGRGLEALLGEGAVAPNSSQQVPIAAIHPNPYQPRKHIDEDELAKLAESIRTHGVLQPLVVRAVPEGYQLVAGERRLRAAQQAGLHEVPVHVVDLDDRQLFEAALVENIHRSDLNPIEKALSFKEYMERFGLTQDELARRLALDRSTISNLLGLLHLPAEVQDAVRLGQITLGHAKVLKGVLDPQRQIALCKETIMRNYSVHALELIVRQQQYEMVEQADGQAAVRVRSSRPEKTPHVQAIEDELRQRLAVKVDIRVRGKERGEIVLSFQSNDDFERLVEALRR